MLTTKKTQKSPLTYPNDRPGLASLVHQYIPEGRRIATPFLGGGSLEMGLASRGHNVVAYTEYRLLYDFWLCAMRDPDKLYKMASSFYPIEDPRMFSMLQKKVYEPDDEYLRSALFYVLNHCSEEGRTTAGHMEAGTPRFNEMRLSQLASFETSPFSLELEKYTSALQKDDFLVCSMPKYMRANLQGAVIVPEAPQVNHKKFAKLINERQCADWILIYDYNSDLMELYPEQEKVLLGAGYRPTTNPDRAEEVMIIGS